MNSRLLSPSNTSAESSRISRRKALHWLGITGASSVMPSFAQARENRDRRLIVPAEPGGGIDSMARLLTRVMPEETGVWVVLNKPGASGTIAALHVARAPADGDTLLLTGSYHLAAPQLMPNLGFDPISDFSPLIRLARSPNVILVNDSANTSNLSGKAGLNALISRSLSYGSAGYGSSHHLSVEQFKSVTHAPWLHVPYKGSAGTLRALMSNEVQVVFSPIAAATTAIQSGKVHPIAVAHTTRVSSLPQVPTLRELGLPHAEYQQWYGMLMPRSADEKLLNSLAQQLQRATQSPQFMAGLERMALEPAVLGPREFRDFLDAEMRRTRQLLAQVPVDRPVE